MDTLTIVFLLLSVLVVLLVWFVDTHSDPPRKPNGH